MTDANLPQSTKDDDILDEHILDEHSLNEQALAEDVTGRLLMLASSNLPIGSYTYSQGIEPAIEAGIIHDEDSTLQFMHDYLELALEGYELPLLALIVKALTDDYENLANALSADYHASRESKEFVYESDQLAISLSAWLDEVLALNVPEALISKGFLPLFANICAHWQIKVEQAMTTYAFGQIENMVLAAVKTVPLGQMAGQRIIWQLQQALSHIIKNTTIEVNYAYHSYIINDATLYSDRTKYADGTKYEDNTKYLERPNIDSSSLNQLYQQLNMSSNLPNLAKLSCQHERQYSRLFRS